MFYVASDVRIIVEYPHQLFLLKGYYHKSASLDSYAKYSTARRDVIATVGLHQKGVSRIGS